MLKEQTPQNKAGIRRDPAASLPKAPFTNPNATNAASPPDDPPELQLKLYGLQTLPKILFLLSIANNNYGTFPLAKIIAPFLYKNSIKAVLEEY